MNKVIIIQIRKGYKSNSYDIKRGFYAGMGVPFPIPAGYAQMQGRGNWIPSVARVCTYLASDKPLTLRVTLHGQA